MSVVFVNKWINKTKGVLLVRAWDVFTCQKMVDTRVWFGRRRPTTCKVNTWKIKKRNRQNIFKDKKSFRKHISVSVQYVNNKYDLTTGVPNGINPV